jgi:hypothetical protein
MAQDISTRIETIIRETNKAYKNNALQNLDRSDKDDLTIKTDHLQLLTSELRDISGDATRDWQRIVTTEISNAIGIASADRIVADNKDRDLNEVYCYKIIVGDEKTCKSCRKFYQDKDNSPKLYRLSTLLSNGTNVGKSTNAWLPVVNATHPNTRTSQIIELKPGYKLLPGGSTTYIGLDKWAEYLEKKLIS